MCTSIQGQIFLLSSYGGGEGILNDYIKLVNDLIADCTIWIWAIGFSIQ